jgi:hypothetical protein
MSDQNQPDIGSFFEKEKQKKQAQKNIQKQQQTKVQ